MKKNQQVYIPKKKTLNQRLSQSNKIVISNTGVPQMINYVKSDIKVTIGMLVSNHKQYIRKAMESIKPLLDAVPSELIIVDTVGPEKTDGSLDIVKEYTDKIYHFDWINDFSAARNVALEHARGEWFLYFDDDEYFDDVTEFIEFFKSGECNKYGYGLYYTGDYTTPYSYSKSVAGRVIRRCPDTRFVGRIHETFNEAHYPVKQFEAFTHHFGYMYQTNEQRLAKLKRNTDLLEQDLKEKGPNDRTCAQLIQELMATDEVEAIKRCIEFIKALEGKPDLEQSLGQWLLLANVKFMTSMGSLQGVLAQEELLLSQYKLFQTARLVLAYHVAGIAYLNQRWDIVSDRVKIYLENLNWLNTHPDHKIEQSQLDFPKYMMEHELFATIRMGIVAEVQLGNYDKAYEYIKKLDFNYCKDFEEIRKLIELTLGELDDLAPLTEYYKHFYRDEFFEDPELRKFLPSTLRNRL